MINLFTEPTPMTVKITNVIYAPDQEIGEGVLGVDQNNNLYTLIYKCQECTKEFLYEMLNVTSDNFLDDVSLECMTNSEHIFQINKPYGKELEQIEFHKKTKQVFLKKYDLQNGIYKATYFHIDGTIHPYTEEVDGMTIRTHIFDDFTISLYKNDVLSYLGMC